MPKDDSFTDGQVITPDVCLGTAFRICKRAIAGLQTDANASIHVPNAMLNSFQEAGATAARIAKGAGWNGNLVINGQTIEL